jgi:hypothetical protein
MTTQTSSKPAAEICRHLRLGHRARALLEPQARAGDFLRTLIEAECWEDAVAFMTRAMPTRHAVWWACLCVRHRLGKKPTDRDKEGVLAATRCVVAPSVEHFQHVETLARELDGKSPSGCLVRAAVHLGVPERPDLAVRLAAAAISLVIASAGPGRRDFLYRQYIYIGLDVAHMALSWK